jgi:hypothetical protein
MAVRTQGRQTEGAEGHFMQFQKRNDYARKRVIDPFRQTAPGRQLLAVDFFPFHKLDCEFMCTSADQRAKANVLHINGIVLK